MIFKKLLDPGQQEMKSQGFKPNFLINLLRLFSKVIIFFLRLNGRTRWSNEFIQQLNPSITMNFDNRSIWFRTGHGRLYWRSKHAYEFEPETNEWIKNFQQDDIFYDIGANIGVYSLLSSKLMNVKTYAFEPDLMNARIMYENIIKNDVSDLVTIFPVALADRSYSADLYLKTLSYGDALHNLDKKNDMVTDKNEAKILIPAFSLDYLVDTLNLDKPTKMKIDVDGIEYRVIQGANNSLDNVRELIIEWTREENQHVQILDFLEKKGFKLQWESEPHNSYSGTVNALLTKK